MCSDNVREEIETRFTPKKTNSLLLAASYGRLGYDKKRERVADCGSVLDFAYEISADGVVSDTGRLHGANFCKDRLCPMCAWRRSYKIFGQVSQIMQVMEKEKYKFLFLTLTVPNCAPADLSRTLDLMLRAWSRFFRYRKISKVVKGFFRALEITRNDETGYFHPHFHVVLAVPVSYLKSRDYLTHEEWLNLWRKACQDDSITQVDIRVMKNKHSAAAEAASNELASAVAEVAKYAVKDNDYIKPDDPGLTDSIVETLSGALHHRRLVAFGGVFLDAFKRLQLDDSEDGDLVHLDDKLNPALAWLVVRHRWSCGVYSMAETFVKEPEKTKD